MQSLVDDNVMQVLEGMEGAQACPDYIFVKSRVNGKQLLTSGGLASSITKTKFVRDLNLQNMRYKNKDGKVSSSSAAAASASSSASASASTPAKVSTSGSGCVSGHNQRSTTAASAASAGGAGGAGSGSSTSGYSTTSGYRHVTPAQELKFAVRDHLRELEKDVRNVRDNMFKEFKRRREDVRFDVEAAWKDVKKDVSEDGYLGNKGVPAGDPHVLGYNASDPEKLEQPFPLPRTTLELPGDQMGTILELWTFLITFGEALDVHTVPDLNTTIAAFQSVDPLLRSIHSKLVTLPAGAALAHELASCVGPVGHRSRDSSISTFCKDNSFNSAVATASAPDLLSIPPKQAHTLLDRIGMLLTKLLLPEYYKLMNSSMDNAKALNIHLHVNILNWREIARSVLIYGTCRDMGVTELEGLANHRGRTLQMYPDMFETRTINLIRARLLMKPILRKRNRDNLLNMGCFRTGFVVRLKAPGAVRGWGRLSGPRRQYKGPLLLDGVALEPQVVDLRWQLLLCCLIYVPDSAGWLAHKLVSAAIANLSGLGPVQLGSADRASPDFSHAAAIVAALQAALKPPFFQAHDASWLKRVSEVVLRRYAPDSERLLSDTGPFSFVKAGLHAAGIALCDPSMVPVLTEVT
jgi:hypothetical protein